MLGCEVPRKDYTRTTISNLGTKIVEHPIARGFQVDGMLKTIFERELPWEIRYAKKSSLVVLTGSPYLPSRVRTYANDVIFGFDNIKQVAMYTPSVLASLAMVRLEVVSLYTHNSENTHTHTHTHTKGCVTSCVLSSGHDTSHVVSIFDGHCSLGKHCVPTYVAGRDTTDWLLSQCKNRQHLRTSDREFIRAVKDASRSGDMNEFLILPDGQRFSARKIQDALFNPKDVMPGFCCSKSIGVSEAVRRCIERVKDKSLRNKVVRNIILEGGSTNAGSVSLFESRLEKSLSDLNAQVNRTPEDEIDGLEWRSIKGGKIASEIIRTWGSDTKGYGQIVSKEEYWEHGPNIFLRKYGWT